MKKRNFEEKGKKKTNKQTKNKTNKQTKKKNKNNKLFWIYGEKVRFHEIWHQSAWEFMRKRVLRTDGRTTDAGVTRVVLLCSSKVAQSRAKNGLEIV